VTQQEQWSKVKEAVAAALERPAAERSAYLDGVCDGDPSLRAEVDSLLSAYETSDGLSTPAWLGQLQHNQSFTPNTIGPYHLIRKLGEGGMGQVWLAEQTAPVQRQVALKLIRAGMFDESVLQRFQSERQSLAIMDHPAIAKVFDAGATPEGQPYFVMEYVPGLPITDYCDLKKLKLRDRLELFIQVCEGVQHAHQKAIIHRDLKPANLLVVEVDGKPRPRIIDFGLAKAAVPQAGGASLFTQIGGFVGTPGYMSPEQANPDILDVDTRTDVYSLGVVLYVLLTGSLPFEAKQKRPLDEVLRQLREEDPPRPSTRVNLDAKEPSSATTAAARATEPQHLVSELRGDLDWITMKAVERDRARRYGTPSELAADLRRYLNNEPVLARPASAGYRLRKYVRRHRISVAAAAVIAGLLIAFGIVQASQLRRITRERDRANRITDFMTRMFKVSDPSEARGNTVTAREILDKASKDIDTGLAKDPEQQAQMMDVMGSVYQSLGLYSSAQDLLQRAVAIQTRALGPEDPRTLASIDSLASALDGGGHYTEAEKLERQNLEVSRRVLGPEHPDSIRAMRTLGTTLENEGHYPEAEKLDREALELSRRVLGEQDPDTLAAMNSLGFVLQRSAHYSEAEKLHAEALKGSQTVLGPDHPQTLASMRSLAGDFRGERKYAEAEKLDREALEIRQRILGPEHPQTLVSMTELARDLWREGKLADSEQLSRRTLEIQLRVRGPEHPDTITTLHNLAIVLQQQGRYAESEQINRAELEAYRHTLGPEHTNTAASMNNLALDLWHEGKFAEAEQLNRQALEIQRRALGPDHPNTIGAMDNLMNCLASEHKYAEGEQLARQIVELKRRVFGPDDVRTADAVYDLGHFLVLLGKKEEAIPVLRQAVDHGLRRESLLDVQTDADFNSLRADPRFKAIVADAKQRAAAPQK
jgi:eukaryotic-like serine/threonine-protein kinase